MRTKTFTIGGDMIAPFFGFLDTTMLQVQLVGINDEQEIVTEIGYTEDDKESMMDLIELYDELIEAREQEEESEEEELDEQEEEPEEEEEEKPKRKTKRRK